MESTDRSITPPEGRAFETLNCEISSDDEMWTNSSHYVNVGLSAIECIDRALKYCGRGWESVHSILDIPCGHGRVARFLRSWRPQAFLTVSDLNIAAVRFSRPRFADDAMISDRKLGQLAFGRRYDLVWVGSLVTHLDEKRTVKLLKVLGRHLELDGVLVVTSHGECSADRMRLGDYIDGTDARAKILKDHGANGFGYADYPGQTGYGISLINRRWFMDNAGRCNLRLRVVFEQAWDNHHDVAVFQRKRWWHYVFPFGG